MGNVGIIYTLMPEDIETDLEVVMSKIRADISEEVTINSLSKQPVAFGLFSLELQVIMDDKKGGGDQLENFLDAIPGVSSVRVISQTLIS